jgi:putative membrane protein
MCTLVRAQDTAQDKQLEPKNSSVQPNKNETNDQGSDADMQAKMKEQEKLKADLMNNYNDADFVKILSMGNASEIAAAQQAIQKTHNDDVKMLAQHMLDDHTAAGNELGSLAASKGWTVSDQPDVKHQMKMKDMNDLAPADFDKAYASAQVTDHQETIALMKYAQDKTSDDQLKGFINKELPTFQEHLRMAQDLDNKLTAMGSAR